VDILFQQNWNKIFVFVIVGLDPTIQKILDSSTKAIVLYFVINHLKINVERVGGGESTFNSN
jgi:ABC-type siderophore export system fused ATPase/permease subunit